MYSRMAASTGVTILGIKIETITHLITEATPLIKATAILGIEIEKLAHLITEATPLIKATD